MVVKGRIPRFLLRQEVCPRVKVEKLEVSDKNLLCLYVYSL